VNVDAVSASARQKIEAAAAASPWPRSAPTRAAREEGATSGKGGRRPGVTPAPADTRGRGMLEGSRTSSGFRSSSAAFCSRSRSCASTAWAGTSRPGVNGEALVVAFSSQANSLFGLYDLFVGARSRRRRSSRGIMPYIRSIISSSSARWSVLSRSCRRGREGRKKITQYTRVGTVLLSALQAIAFAKFLESMNAGGVAVFRTRASASRS